MTDCAGVLRLFAFGQVTVTPLTCSDLTLPAQAVVVLNPTTAGFLRIGSTGATTSGFDIRGTVRDVVRFQSSLFLVGKDVSVNGKQRIGIVALDCSSVNCRDADFNGDGVVNQTDLTLFTNCFNLSGGGPNPLLDIDESGFVTPADLTAYTTIYNACR